MKRTGKSKKDRKGVNDLTTIGTNRDETNGKPKTTVIEKTFSLPGKMAISTQGVRTQEENWSRGRRLLPLR